MLSQARFDQIDNPVISSLDIIGNKPTSLLAEHENLVVVIFD